MLPCTRLTAIGSPLACVHSIAASAIPPTAIDAIAAAADDRGKIPAALQRRCRVHQQRSGCRDGETDQECAADRRESCERTTDLRIAGREPGKARIPGAVQPLGDRPGARGDRQTRRRAWRREPCGSPARQRRKQREVYAEACGAYRGQNGDHAAERAQGDVGPRGPGAEQADAVRVTEPRRGVRRCGSLPEREQSGERQQRDGPRAERRKAEDAGDAEQQGGARCWPQHQAPPGSGSSSGGGESFSTCSV